MDAAVRHTTENDAPPAVAQTSPEHDTLAGLMREHDGWLRSVILGVTGEVDLVEDTIQETWLRAWRRMQQLQQPERLRAWLYRIARNAALDAASGRGRQRRLNASHAQQNGVPLVAPADAAVHQSELQRLLLNTICGLPPQYRAPFVLRHLEEWSYKEIASTLGLTVEAVETRLVRARRMLRETLAGTI